MQTTRTDETGNKLNQTPKKKLPTHYHLVIILLYDGGLLKNEMRNIPKENVFVLKMSVTIFLLLLLPFSETENLRCCSRLRYS